MFTYLALLLNQFIINNTSFAILPKIEHWEIIEQWDHSHEATFTGSYSSTWIVEQCKKSPEKYVKMPFAYSTSYDFMLDDKKIDFPVDYNRLEYSFLNINPEIACAKLLSGKNFQWKIESYLLFFPKLLSPPKITDKESKIIRMCNTTLPGCFGIVLICFSLLILVLSYGTNVKDKYYTFSYNLGFGIFLFATHPGVLELSFPHDFSWEIGSSSFWISTWLILMTFNKEEKINKIVFIFYSIYFLFYLLTMQLSDSQTMKAVLMYGIQILALLSFLSIIKEKLPEYKEKNLRSIFSLWILCTLALCGSTETLRLYGVSVPSFIWFGLFTFSFYQIIEVNKMIIFIAKEHSVLDFELKRKAQFEESLITATNMLTHDIRKPISFSKSIISLLKNVKDFDSFQAYQNKFVPILLDSFDKSESMLLEILNSNKVSSFDSKPFSIKTVVNDSLYECFGNSKKEINIDVQINLKYLLLANYGQISRVLTNLIANAERYMEQNMILYIECHQDGDYCKISVKNEGSYISREEQKKLFDSFYTTSDNHHGLGLAICKYFVEKSNGEITVSSNANPKWTQFIIKLPLSQEIDDKVVDFANSSSFYSIEKTGN